MRKLRPRAQLTRQEAPVLPLPPAVVSRLTALWHLEGLPLYALIPDARMLPPESLRFFSLDPNWMRALLAGAFSVGRSSSDQLSADAEAISAFICGLAGVDLLSALPARSGVLLRSAVVSGWPKMRIVAFDATGGAVTLERRAVLGKDTMLLLFSGPIVRTEFSEPAEGVHFGVELDGSKNLRYITGPKAGAITDYKVESLARRAGAPSVLDVCAAQAVIASTVEAKQLNLDAARQPRAFGAAEFAAEMIHGVEQVRLTLNNPVV